MTKEQVREGIKYLRKSLSALKDMEDPELEELILLGIYFNGKIIYNYYK